MWFHCHSDTQSIWSNVINVQIQIINQFPYLSQCLPIASVIESWAGRTAAPQLCLQPTHKPPKKPLPGGEEIIKGDLPYPQHWLKYESQKVESPTKINPTFPANKLEKNLDENGWKITLIWSIRMELKIIPFRLQTKINK